MRKIKWLFGLGAMSSLMALPLIAASCKKESLEQVTKAYKDAYLEFNNAIEKDAAKLKEFKNSINEQKQDDKKKEILKQKNDWVKKQIPILQGLRKKANDAFKKLRDVQKNQKIQIIKLVHTNDEHGRLVFDDGKFNNYSGMQGLAEVMSRDFDRDLLLSAGDLIQGLPLSDSDKGLTISKVAHQMGYDAVAIGNHEFDWGLPHMFDIEKATERMPFLSANTVWNEKALNGKVKIRKEDGSFTEIDVKTKDGKTPKVGEKVFTPYIIKTLKSGLKVGIMGITTPDTKFTSLPINSEHVDFLDPVQSANKAVEELKAQGVNFIVALTHLGVNRSDTAWDGREFAKKAKGVDIVLDGHSHTLVKIEAHQNNKTYLTQAECHTKYLSELDITINAETGDVLDVQQQVRTIEYTELLGGKENKLEKINKLIDDLRKEFDTINKAIVFKSEIDFVHVENFEITHKDGKKSHHWKGRTQQTNLGTFGSDALAWEFIKANPQFEGRNNDEFNLDNVIGLMNGGGLRKDVPAGDVKREDILGISPFGNRAGAVRIKGSTFLKLWNMAH
ncbi:2',3'-cyclic-nucleotide 2'-phosphodiesterase (5'-nucleotidase family) [Metamycoplasma alkalescens]|uniref:2',3'-cyclic-nucleotide 2'-phosphodiesterase (5'-nucleotidase family) n=3 Tax=Metamycoplasma alkalescens TaxID=45363 RepID=A0A318UIV1_9BACT|nr:2',3'-cyclic-nucleotide 2'-phosphodiesterase (5'-nucleotidase family) [Metamycoplasma alkalescens]